MKNFLKTVTNVKVLTLSKTTLAKTALQHQRRVFVQDCYTVHHQFVIDSKIVHRAP